MSQAIQKAAKRENKAMQLSKTFCINVVTIVK